MSIGLESRSLLEDYDVMDGQTDVEQYVESDINSNHCHSLLLSKKEDDKTERVLRVVAILSAIFILTELVGGVLANSLSIITDAGHMLSDFFSFLVSLIMMRVSKLPANKRASFGFARAEILGALMSIIIIWMLTILLVVFATQRLLSGKLDVEPNTMLLTAVLGVFFNIAMALVLICSKNGSHGHSHTHFNQNSNSSKLEKNVNIRAAFVHVIGDLVQSLGVLSAGVIIKLTGWMEADALCTYFFSIIVLCTSLPVFRDIWRVLIEATPKGINYTDIYQDLLSVDNTIRQVHSLHIWALNAQNLCATVHFVIDDQLRADTITKIATKKLQQKYGIMHTTVQTEVRIPVENKDYSDCNFCKPLL